MAVNSLSLILLISLVYSVSVQGCTFPDGYSNSFGWFANEFSNNDYLYYQYGAKVTMKTASESFGGAENDCLGLTSTNNFEYFLYPWARTQKICARAFMTTNKRALLLSEMRDDTATDVNTCTTKFTDSCFNAGDCAASWRPRVSPPFNFPPPFSSHESQCPISGEFQATITGEAVAPCTTTVAVTQNQLVIGSCQAIASPSTRKDYILKGATFTCMGTATLNSANVLLLGIPNSVNLYCAHYETDVGGTKLMIDASEKVGIPCGVVGNNSNVFLTAMLTSPTTGSTSSKSPAAVTTSGDQSKTTKAGLTPASGASVTAGAGLTGKVTAAGSSGTATAAVVTGTSVTKPQVSTAAGATKPTGVTQPSAVTTKPGDKSTKMMMMTTTTTVAAPTVPGMTESASPFVPPNPCTGLTCPRVPTLQVCVSLNGTASCRCPPGSPKMVNGTCPPDPEKERIIKGALIGLLAGSTVASAVAGLVLLFGAGPLEGAAAAGGTTTTFAGNTAGAPQNVMVPENTMNTGFAQRGAFNNPSFTGDKYVMVGSTIPK